MAEKGPLFQTFKRVRNSLRSAMPGVFVLGKGLSLIYSGRSFLRTSGYWESVAKKKPCRKDGSPIPWMNYAVIAFLEQRLQPEHQLFEYGSGNSTLFFAARVGSVDSVECDEGWHDYVKDSLPANVSLSLVPKGGPDYVGSIGAKDQRYDMVIVDAEDRVECMLNAPNHLSDAGVIVLDDSSRPDYVPGVEGLKAQGFKALDFEGLKAGAIRSYRTSIYYRANNCLGL